MTDFADSIKPRRLCDFCERGKRMESAEKKHEMNLLTIAPVTPIDLTNQNMEKIKFGKPYCAMSLYTTDKAGEAATFPVKFCPMCGRKLVTE